VPSATIMSRNVQCAQSPHDLVPGFGPGDVGAVGEFADRLNKCVPIESGLPCAEILGRPFKDICEIKLCCRTKANAPFPLGHEALFGCAGNDLFREVIQISLQVLDFFELFELAPIQCIEADAGCFP